IFYKTRHIPFRQVLTDTSVSLYYRYEIMLSKKLLLTLTFMRKVKIQLFLALCLTGYAANAQISEKGIPLGMEYRTETTLPVTTNSYALPDWNAAIAANSQKAAAGELSLPLVGVNTAVD